MVSTTDIETGVVTLEERDYTLIVIVKSDSLYLISGSSTVEVHPWKIK